MVEFEAADEAVNMVVVQLNALGLIDKGIKRRPIQDKNIYWRLTPAGEKYMYELRAIRKPSLFD